MIPIWWTLVTFVAGGCAGLLLIALMRTASDRDDDAFRPIDPGDRPCSIRNG